MGIPRPKGIIKKRPEPMDRALATLKPLTTEQDRADARRGILAVVEEYQLAKSEWARAKHPITNAEDLGAVARAANSLIAALKSLSPEAELALTLPEHPPNEWDRFVGQNGSLLPFRLLEDLVGRSKRREKLERLVGPYDKGFKTSLDRSSGAPELHLVWLCALLLEGAGRDLKGLLQLAKALLELAGDRRDLSRWGQDHVDRTSGWMEQARGYGLLRQFPDRRVFPGMPVVLPVPEGWNWTEAVLEPVDEAWMIEHPGFCGGPASVPTRKRRAKKTSVSAVRAHPIE